MGLRRLRIWKLGSIKHKIFPTPEAIERLAHCIKNMPKEGDVDLIWGPEISCEEHYVTDEELDIIVKDPSVNVLPSKVYLPNKYGKVVVKDENASK